MSAIDTSVTETEVDNQVERLRRRCDSALQRRLDNPDCLSPAALIRILSPVIEKYLAAGLVLEEVAKALQEEGFSVTKGHLVRNLGVIRAENGLPPIKRGKKAQPDNEMSDAPAARGGRGQKDAQAPVAATVTSSPVPATPAAAPVPRQAPQPVPLPGQKNDDDRPRGVSAEMWAMKPKIDKILHTYPPPDREYPELVGLRFWTDSSGKKWDVRGEEKPVTEVEFRDFDRAKIMHGSRWRVLMEKWGLAQDIQGVLTPRYKIAEEYLQPLTVNLAEIIAKHLD